MTQSMRVLLRDLLLCGLVGLAGACTDQVVTAATDLSTVACTAAPFTVESPPVIGAPDGGTIDCTTYCENGFIADDFGVPGKARPQVLQCAVIDRGGHTAVSCTYASCP